MAEESPYVCEEHNIKRLPRGFKRCPVCEELSRIQGEWEHEMTRDPMVEPW